MPPNNTSLEPFLSVRNAKAAVEFYKTAFQAEPTFYLEDPDGNVVARLALDQAAFWVSDESPEHQNFAPPTLQGSTVRLALIVPDPDAVQSQAIQAGATEITPVEDNYGWRLGRIQDPFGHHWEIGHPLD